MAILKSILSKIYLCSSNRISFSPLTFVAKPFYYKVFNRACIGAPVSCMIQDQRFFSTHLVLRKENDIKEDDSIYLGFLDEKEYDQVSSRQPKLLDYSRIAILQPWIKWGPKKRKDTTAKLLLDEACALVQSLPYVQISYMEPVNLTHFLGSVIFTSGILERLVNEAKAHKSDAVFISINHLKPSQIRELQEAFGVPIFDRYMVVLEIFKHYAYTMESKLQISLAELPYIRKHIATDDEKVATDKRQSLLKKALKKVSGNREAARKNRHKNFINSIAIVGYTNCGKTSLIKALTGDPRAEGKNRLFATLDVTSHGAPLPCGLRVTFVDTVGFIQDIPTDLIASFQSTLEDAIYADVVIYMRDISHADFYVQNRTVEKTLKDLPLPEATPILIVNNKCDLLSEEDLQNALVKFEAHNGLNISAETGEGLEELLYRVESKIIAVSGRKRYRMKVPTGSPKVRWLRGASLLTSEDVNADDPQFTTLQVVMNAAEVAAFKRAFR